MPTSLRFVLPIALVVFTLARPARADDFEAHYQQAATLYAAENYRGAIQELEAAYRIKQPPRILYELARAHQKLGDGKEALDLYRKYLAAEAHPDPQVKADVDAQLKLLAGLEPPPPPAAPKLIEPIRAELTPVHFVEQHDRGLIAGGVSLLATSYAAAVITGSIFASINNDGYDGSSTTPDPNGDLQAAGGTLLIPVVGPLISSLVYRTPAWSIPWSMVDGAAQVAGLAMAIAGARIKHKVPVLDRFQLAPYGNATGGGMVLSGRF